MITWLCQMNVPLICSKVSMLFSLTIFILDKKNGIIVTKNPIRQHQLLMPTLQDLLLYEKDTPQQSQKEDAPLNFFNHD